MVDVGRGYTTLEEFCAILSANDRREGGPNAPARGLTLESVLYEETMDNDHNRQESAQ
jgi:tRNA U38,U39,U40 pseudouridine synthase TruA